MLSVPQDGGVMKRRCKRETGGESEEAQPGSLGETGELASRGEGGRRQGDVTELAGVPRGPLSADRPEPRFRSGGGRTHPGLGSVGLSC